MASACSFPVPAASARFTACSAPPPPASSSPAHALWRSATRSARTASCSPSPPRRSTRWPALRFPELIVGHGVLGRLLARLTVLAGGAPTIWERNPARADGAAGYTVVDPADDTRRDYRAIYDASGDAGLIDTLVMRLAPGGEIVLAGFYSESPVISPSRPPSCGRRGSASQPSGRTADLAYVAAATSGPPARSTSTGLITHRESAARDRAGRLPQPPSTMRRLPENGPGLERLAHECDRQPCRAGARPKP